ncbi:MAG TPA: DoxX family protein [Bryobacteraceae bacterium]|nr:DoxX family protein [Bryobacteraceae bacterium]HPU72482.1 DoxX family protein [Bryobacteraceae bacterium]
MDDSMAHPNEASALWVPAGWKAAVSHIAAFLIALLFIIAGVWKITDPFGAAARLVEARVPASLSLIGAVLLGVGELFAGVLILVPRYRRWGAWLISAMLVFFVIYIGALYDVLRGEECNCFPWVKRAIGPGFFIGDGIMLALAVIAGWWARPSRGIRGAVLVLLAVAVFAGASYGVHVTMKAWIMAPESITVDGKPFPLREGRVLLFFYNPECAHCMEVARAMSTFQWNSGVTIISAALEQPHFAEQFVSATGLPALITDDVEPLREVYSPNTVPYIVALENGRVKQSFVSFEEPDFESRLKALGFTN